MAKPITIRGLKPIVIRESVDQANQQGLSEIDFEKALEMGCDLIIIEPRQLGEATAHWIYLGNSINNTSLITGTCALISTFFVPDKPFVYFSLSTLSLLCSTCYKFVWQKDPCSNYYVSSPREVQLEPLNIDTNAKIVLIKRNNGFFKQIHAIRMAISLIAFAFSAWRIFHPTLRLSQ